MLHLLLRSLWPTSMQRRPQDIGVARPPRSTGCQKSCTCALQGKLCMMQEARQVKRCDIDKLSTPGSRGPSHEPQSRLNETMRECSNCSKGQRRTVRPVIVFWAGPPAWQQIALPWHGDAILKGAVNPVLEIGPKETAGATPELARPPPQSQRYSSSQFEELAPTPTCYPLQRCHTRRKKSLNSSWQRAEPVTHSAAFAVCR